MRSELIALILGFLLLFSGCVERQEAPEVLEQETTEEWKADGIVGPGEYSRSVLLQSPARQGYSGGELTVSWKNDKEHLYLALNGSTDAWLSIGFDPLEWMKNADIILASVQGGKAVVLDEYCTGNYGPHIEDTMLGGSDDILESGGSKSADRTIIELKRRLDTGDHFDKAFSPGGTVSVIWALSSSPDISLKHNIAYGEGILSLTGGEATASGASVAALSSREKDGLLFIWEEEKAARDLYTGLYEKNNLSIFLNLIGSESSHMDQARAIMEKHGLAVLPDEPGKFQNMTLQEIHDQLLAEGLQSDQDALAAAAAFEEISIIDLERELSVSQAEDVIATYQGLLAGSRKHLRSYVSDLEDQGIEYQPRYMEAEQFQDIVKS
ncbi:MAG: DUF2202 domain-containing protein [Methanothrix sp.]|nr:DUF2202 domain-containing protein [Methanothrix sp.]